MQAPSLFQRGNQAFRELIQEHQTVYLCSKRSDKPRLAWKIFDIASSRGGRFVRRNKGQQQQNQLQHTNDTTVRGTGVEKDGKMKSNNRGTLPPPSSSSSSFAWEQLSDKQAYEKICQSLREGAPEFRRRMMFASVNKSKRQSDDGGHRTNDGAIHGDDDYDDAVDATNDNSNDYDSVKNCHPSSSSSLSFRPEEYSTSNTNAAETAAPPTTTTVEGNTERRYIGKDDSAAFHPQL
jgi:hypothetical protein